MKILLSFKFFFAAKSTQAKERVAKKIISNFNVESRDLTIRESDSSFEFYVECASWELALYKILKTCQSVGRQWILTGNINFEFSAWTNHPLIVGIESISVNADNPAHKDDGA